MLKILVLVFRSSHLLFRIRCSRSVASHSLGALFLVVSFAQELQTLRDEFEEDKAKAGPLVAGSFKHCLYGLL